MSLVERLASGDLDKELIVKLLEVEDSADLFNKSREIKKQYVGNKTYLRGLIELSNICQKDCFYCGIRASKKDIERYSLSDQEVIDACKYAQKQGYGSLVIQTGERENHGFIEQVSKLLKLINDNLDQKMRITLSCGEQNKEVYRKWKELGADRYLLRIEASNPFLFKQLHPDDKRHSFEKRLHALDLLRECGYQVGSGFMVGVPGQSLHDIASDILFLYNQDIDMVGIGPYVQSDGTPTAKLDVMSQNDRFDLTLKVLAIVRIALRDVNIAAATALQALKPKGREEALKIGANVIMPNITPPSARMSYTLYQNKPQDSVGLKERDQNLFNSIKEIGDEVIFGEFGDSKHYLSRS